MLHSVLTRILPWGVAGSPLQKNRGSVRMLEGQRLKVTRGPWRTCKNLSCFLRLPFVICSQLLFANKNRVVQIIWACTPKGFLHEVHTWSNMADQMFTITYDLIAILTQTFTAYMWPMRLKAIKVKALSFLINVFIHLNKQNAGVFDWRLNYS